MYSPDLEEALRQQQAVERRRRQLATLWHAAESRAALARIHAARRRVKEHKPDCKALWLSNRKRNGEPMRSRCTCYERVQAVRRVPTVGVHLWHTYNGWSVTVCAKRGERHDMRRVRDFWARENWGKRCERCLLHYVKIRHLRGS